MNRQQWQRTLWREWASCDFEDEQYLNELLGLVGDMRGGLLGAVMTPLWFAIWLPLASLQMIAFVLAVAIYFQGHDFVGIVSSAGMLLTALALVGLGLALICGAFCRWKHILGGLACLRIGLAIYVGIGERMATPPDDNAFAKVYCGMFVIGVAIASLIGVAYIFSWYDLGWAGAILAHGCLLAAGGLSLSPLLLTSGAGVGSFLGKGPRAASIRRFCLWWRPRPDYRRLEDALLMAGDEQTKKLVARARSAELDADALPKWIGHLHGASWQDRFEARHICIRYGGLAVESLRAKRVDVATSVLRCISADTSGRLGFGRFLCPDCLCQVLPHDVGDWRFWGCRRCRRSHDLFGPGRRIVALLDSDLGANVAVSSGDIRVNRLACGELFDFDRAEIIRASDEQVESFATDVRNETDPFRLALLCKAHCRILPGHELQENTIRILRQAFRRVTVGKSNRAGRHIKL